MLVIYWRLNGAGTNRTRLHGPVASPAI